MNTKGNVTAIILARGGSKAIPRKNLVRIAGRPLIECTLARARTSPSISRVIVSTDDREIADVADGFGADIIWRPPELCTDTASSESGLKHCLDQLREVEGFEPDLVVFLQPTSPLRSSQHIEDAISLIGREGADSLFSVGPLRGLVWKLEENTPIPVSYDPQHRVPRQEGPRYIAENGSIYLFKPWVLWKLGCRLGGKTVVFRMDAMDSFEVDEPDDIPIVEFLLRRRYPDLVGD